MRLKTNRPRWQREAAGTKITRQAVSSVHYLTRPAPPCQIKSPHVVSDFLLPLADRAEQLAQRDADPARRKRHAKLARYLIHRIARAISKRRARWWESGGVE